MVRVDYTEGARAYRRARTLPAEVLESWRAAIGRADVACRDRVLDLGAGTGGFLAALDDWFNAPVVAVEPSAAMRAEAASAGLTAGYAYIAGFGESVPLRSASVDVAWLSTMIHQVDDRDEVAVELRRVLRGDGRVLIRGFFSDVAITGLLAAFPGVERSAASFPSTAEVVSSFERAGFRAERVEDVVGPWRVDLGSWSAGVRSMRHIDSAL